MAKSKARKSSTDIQREILGVLSTLADVSVTQLAALLRLKPHVVRYNLEALVEDGKISSTLFLNHRALGYHQYNIFFDLPSSKVDRVVSFFQGRPEVSWLTSVTGPRRFEVTLVVRSFEAFVKLLQELGQATDTHLREPIFGVEGEFRHWGLRFLSTQRPVPFQPIVHFSGEREPHAIDNLDRQILKLPDSPDCASLRHLAAALRVPQTTLKYRFDRLKAANVISDRLYLVEPNTYFVHAQIVLNLKSRSVEQVERLVAVCAAESHVEGLITGAGNWDYKILLVADSYTQLLSVENAILRALGRTVTKSSLYLREQIFVSRPVVLP